MSISIDFRTHIFERHKKWGQAPFFPSFSVRTVHKLEIAALPSVARNDNVISNQDKKDLHVKIRNFLRGYAVYNI